MHFLVRISLVLLAVSTAVGQTGSENPSPSAVQIAGQIHDVNCAADPSQSYALYLPSTYVPSKRWPIIYFFDPGGRGRRPLELYKDVAEQYGFVMAGSNNSRNFGSDPSRSVNAIWQDTHLRFALDGRLTYASGFSGGARVAGLMATELRAMPDGRSDRARGRISNQRGRWKRQVALFLRRRGSGLQLVRGCDVRREAKSKACLIGCRSFSGPHQWAPAAVMEDAIEWLLLKAMQSGIRRAGCRVHRSATSQMQAEAEEAEKKNDPIAELSAFRSLVTISPVSKT